MYEVTNNVEELHARESVLSPPYTVESLNAGTEYRTRIRAVGDEDQESADSIRAVTATRKYNSFCRRIPTDSGVIKGLRQGKGQAYNHKPLAFFRQVLPQKCVAFFR